MKEVFEPNNDHLVMAYSKDLASGDEIVTYKQRRYGFSTSGYVKLYMTEEVVFRAEYNYERTYVNPMQTLIDLSARLSFIKDSIGFDSYSWEPVLIDSVLHQIDEDTLLVSSIDTIDLTVYPGTDSSHILNFVDTTWITVIGDNYPQVDTVLSSDTAGNPLFFFHLKFRARRLNNGYDLTINAVNGSISRLIRDERTSSVGTGMTLYNSYQEFYTKWMGPLAYSGYILLDDVRGDGIHTKMYDGNSGPYDLRDPNNLWYGYNIGWDGFEWSPEEHKQAISVHWAVGKSWDYFNDIFELNSIDGEGRKINVLVNVPSNEIPSCNASFSNSDDKIRFGQSSGGCDAVLTLDVAAHEFTHGVSKYAVQNGTGFNPIGESGALDESFSDIFGCMIEYYATGVAANWSIGDQMTNPPDVRHLNDPNNNPNPSLTLGQPSWYGQPDYWLSASPTSQNDWGGIHINSGVQNHWFYLLSEGGNSPQPGNSSSVQGIGREKAAIIAYRNLAEHMMSNSSYADARIGSILAAVDEFTACSFEVEQTINAWNAVNVHGDGIELQYDLDYDCQHLSNNYVYALNDLVVSCDYSNETPFKSLTAGNIITLEPGFESNTNMHIKIEPCLSGASQKQEAYPSYAGAGSQEEIMSSSSITEEKTEVIVFPNPNQGSFTIKATETIGGTLFDIMGRRVRTMSKIDNNTLFISEVAKGSYLVRVQMADGRVKNAKVVVQ